MENNKKGDESRLLEFAKSVGDAELSAMAEMAIKLSEVIEKYSLDTLHKTSMLARLSAASLLASESNFKKTGCPAPIEYFFMDILTQWLDSMRRQQRQDEAEERERAKMN